MYHIKTAVIITSLLLFFPASFCRGTVELGNGSSAEITNKMSTEFSLHVKKAPLETVLRGLALLIGKNVILSGDLEGIVTADLEQVTPEEAFGTLLDTYGLTAQKKGHTLIIFGVGRKESGKTMVSYRLSYANAQEVATALGKMVENGKISYSSSANAVIVSGTPAEIAHMEAVIHRLDIPEKQVKVEAQVIAVNRSHANELGIDWDFKPLTGSADYYKSVKKTKSGEEENTSWQVDVPKDYAGISYGRAITGHPYTAFFQARLRALISGGHARILAKPNVVTMNGKEAEILIGNKIPVLVERLDNGVRTTTTEYRDAGIKLSYTPRINEKNEITAEVSAEVSTPYLIPEIKAYRIITRQANTLVRLSSGDSLTIGGLTDKEENTTERKIPLLGDLPLLGALFRSENHTAEESEIIIIIKADIIDGEKNKESKKKWQC